MAACGLLGAAITGYSDNLVTHMLSQLPVRVLGDVLITVSGAAPNVICHKAGRRCSAFCLSRQSHYEGVDDDATC